VKPDRAEAVLRLSPSDTTMYHMKASVRDLRYNFPEIERRLRGGQKIEITKRGKVIAELSPAAPKAPAKMPDFRALLRKIYGDEVLAVSGAEIIAADRDRY
jgi:antitoxin (DNA-binding transcriptional repressor) of toxin-antitoxin stability system